MVYFWINCLPFDCTKLVLVGNKVLTPQLLNVNFKYQGLIHFLDNSSCESNLSMEYL